jgi:hypothetical protein
MPVKETGVSYYGLGYVEHAKRDFGEMLNMLHIDGHAESYPTSIAEWQTFYFTGNYTPSIVYNHLAGTWDD